MSNPITFKPRAVDPRHELHRRLEAAPHEHAEALLVVYDIIGEAHRQGLLDAVHGAVAARDTIFAELAKYSAEPVSTNVIRNTLALGKILGSLEPEILSNMSKELAIATDTHKQELNPPSLWQIFKRFTSPEARRGISLVSLILQALGRSTE